MRLLGAVVQVGHDYAGEWNTIRKKCWAAGHARNKFWRIKLHALNYLRRMLRMAMFLVLSWCSAIRYWNKAELASLRTMQLRMCRRVLNLCLAHRKSSISSCDARRDGPTTSCRWRRSHAGMSQWRRTGGHGRAMSREWQKTNQTVG